MTKEERLLNRISELSLESGKIQGVLLGLQTQLEAISDYLNAERRAFFNIQDRHKKLIPPLISTNTTLQNDLDRIKAVIREVLNNEM